MANGNTARLARWQVWLIALSGSALWLSGSVWLILHYFAQVQGEFGPEENPADPWLLRLHGLALIFALLAIGAMFVAHIPKGWSHRRQRVAGVTLCALLAVLIASGYMLYYVSGDDLRQWTSIVHWSLGLPLPAIFTWHYLNGLRARRRVGATVCPQADAGLGRKEAVMGKAAGVVGRGAPSPIRSTGALPGRTGTSD
jgi:hypothetical protein